jgi:uncharacterized protein YndB with AHSA1/START domain
MREIHGQAGATIAAEPGAVFEAITDLPRLPEWNAAIERVVEQPGRLIAGATWVVEMHPARLMRWTSVSTLEHIDDEGLRFSYRTVNADGNPSYTLWRWAVKPEPSGANVSVGWDVYLETPDRQLLAGPIRRRQLRNEVAASLAQLARLLGAPQASDGKRTRP